jgi:hypothetical protein
MFLSETEVLRMLARDMPGWTLEVGSLYHDELYGTVAIVRHGALTKRVYVTRDGISRDKRVQLRLIQGYKKDHPA